MKSDSLKGAEARLTGLRACHNCGMPTDNRWNSTIEMACTDCLEKLLAEPMPDFDAPMTFREWVKYGPVCHPEQLVPWCIRSWWWRFRHRWSRP